MHSEFMFQLSKDKFENIWSQIATLEKRKSLGYRKMRYHRITRDFNIANSYIYIDRKN